MTLIIAFLIQNHESGFFVFVLVVIIIKSHKFMTFSAETEALEFTTTTTLK